MSSLKNTLRAYKQRIKNAINPPPSDLIPESEAEQTLWRETCTHDLVLSGFSDYLQNGTDYYRPVLNPAEFKNLQKIFNQYANSDNCWDQKSLESYLLTQLPEDGDFKALLMASRSALWALTVYFSQWPFNAFISAPITSLAFPAMVRSIAFLCGRHYKMFLTWSTEDYDFNRDIDKPVLEYIFRALATVQPKEQQSGSPPPREDTDLSSQRDILDILRVAQPPEIVHHGKYYERSWLMRDELMPIADRLSLTPPPLSDLSVSAKMLAPLLGLCLKLLEQSNKFESNIMPRSFKPGLKASIIKLQTEGEISFDIFTKWFDYEEQKWLEWDNSLYTIYDCIALLFNTFPNPESLITGRTHNWGSGSEETLRLSALRLLGSTVS